MARSISPVAWAEAAMKNPVEFGGVREATDTCMAELLQTRSRNYYTDYHPWLETGGQCFGAMWAGAPDSIDQWRSPEGFWVISCSVVRPTLGKTYIGLSPAPPDAGVQYGFCPIRLDRTKETALKYFGGGPLTIRSAHISVGRHSCFRVDKMAVAATKLGDQRNVSKAGKRFKELLGNVRLGSFVEEMLQGVYTDSGLVRDTIHNHLHGGPEMIQLVTEKAYPGFLELSLADERSLAQFTSAMGVAANPDWHSDVLGPILCNVVMPAPIFEAVDKNMQLGIPPIVPQYVTFDNWMFNGSWSAPCTGSFTSRDCRLSDPGLKIVGGVINRFNTDLFGGANYWSPNKNPPRAWVDLFVSQLQELGSQEQPASHTSKVDLALLYSRNIPVVLDIAQGDIPRTLRYSKLIRVDTDSPAYITDAVTRECNAEGK